MPLFVMLTRLVPGSVIVPSGLEEKEKRVMERIRAECPDVEWLSSYALLGPYDYLDLFKAPSVDAALRVSTLVRTQGHAQTEVWAGTEWYHFKDLIRGLGSVS